MASGDRSALEEPDISPVIQATITASRRCLYAPFPTISADKMIISAFDVFTVAGFALVGIWLNGIGQKNGYLDAVFAPVPMTAIAVVYDILRGFTQ
jgi:hypothetical protein